ncbi:MAG: TIGR02147 family protein [Bdellovibrionales bacterium]
MKTQIAVQHALRTRLETLRIRYPNYSVRAFAKKVGISPATLSLILQGKRRVSRKLATQLCDKLYFDPQERSEILGGFIEKDSKNRVQNDPQFVQMNMDQHQVIADWRAFAILSLMKTPTFKNDLKWLAERLGASSKEVTTSLETLKRLEMIKEEDGVLKRIPTRYRTTDDVVNISLRQSHQQTLELAQAALESVPVQQRDYTWVTIPMDLQKMNDAKTLIRKFQDDLALLMEEGKEPTEVYRLAMQFFPLTKLEPGGSK